MTPLHPRTGLHFFTTLKVTIFAVNIPGTRPGGELEARLLKAADEREATQVLVAAQGGG